MADIQTDEEQVEQLKLWWSDNGRFVTTGIILGVVLVGGWRFWQNHQAEQAATASEQLNELYQAMDNNRLEEVQASADTLTKEYKATPYDDFALLALAKTQVGKSQYAQAATSLEKVMAMTKDKGIKATARARLARAHMAAGHSDKALDVLSAKTPDAFVAEYATIRGDAHASLMQIEQARESYETAIAARMEQTQDHTQLDRKLAALANLEIKQAAVKPNVVDSE